MPATYWLVPGRLLVGEHPGSQSRAEAMDRLRRFLQAGVTCFVDLTEPRELPSYEALLPFETPDGRQGRVPARADCRPRRAGRTAKRCSGRSP